ncbi:MAG: 5-dehydro-4-deoxy-D-glucuronate isomerase [Oscillospiraceae bacterium]|nr:5-dehydro-4-deoxy-D-glucuronate isomerase [Oscillospiraceae bacterium]
MEIRTASSPRDVKHYDTERLREEFLINDLFAPDEIKTVYTQIDRMIVGSAVPVNKKLYLEADPAIRAEYFLERREIGIMNIGGKGCVTVDGTVYELDFKDALYIGRGSKEIIFESADKDKPSKFYFNSTPAHRTCPTVKITPDSIKPENKVELGSLEDSNHRVINRYILPGQVETCQLVMGMTSLKPGSVWNTMPCHTHDRRMEVYLYFEIPDDAVIFHYMGEPTETRHLVMRSEDAVISPSWSIHCASATHSYTFIWGMAGENQVYDDMDQVAMQDLR